MEDHGTECGRKKPSFGKLLARLLWAVFGVNMVIQWSIITLSEFSSIQHGVRPYLSMLNRLVMALDVVLTLVLVTCAMIKTVRKRGEVWAMRRARREDEVETC